MQLQTIRELIDSGRLRSLVGVMQLTRPVYRVAFVAAAHSSGVLRLLAARPRDVTQIAAELWPDACLETLEAWLEIGVQLGDLRREGGRYALGSELVRRLTSPAHDAIAAALVEVARYHFSVILETPRLLGSGRQLSLGDQDGELIARSTLVLYPFVREAIDAELRRAPARHVLEVGCGSGLYAKYLAEQLPQAHVHALELQPEVGAMARDNVRSWGLEQRISIEVADVSEFEADERFDLITLHNNLYYFPRERRATVLEHLRGLLKPDGRVLITTSCRGSSLGLNVLHLWFAASERNAGLPSKDEVFAQLSVAGFGAVRARRLIPLEEYYSFSADAA